MLTINPEIVPREARGLLGNNVIGHDTINSIGNTSPRDFLNYTRNTVIRFLQENRRNKVKINLVSIIIPYKNPYTSPRIWKKYTRK